VCVCARVRARVFCVYACVCARVRMCIKSCLPSLVNIVWPIFVNVV